MFHLLPLSSSFFILPLYNCALASFFVPTCSAHSGGSVAIIIRSSAQSPSLLFFFFPPPGHNDNHTHRGPTHTQKETANVASYQRSRCTIIVPCHRHTTLLLHNTAARALSLSLSLYGTLRHPAALSRSPARYFLSLSSRVVVSSSLHSYSLFCHM